MNVIDALVVTLGLNDAEFQAKLEKSFKSLSNFANKEAAIEKKRDRDSGEQKRKASETERKQHLERERQVKAATEGYKKLSGAIVGMVSAMGAMAGMVGVKSFIAGSINGLVGVGRASKNLRMSAGDVAAWGKTIEAVGGKSEDMIATMRAMDVELANAAEGFNVDGAFFTFLNNQGIQWKNAAGGVRTMGELLPEIADAFNKFRPEQQAIIAQQNGWNDDFVALLRKGSVEIKRIQAEKHAQTKIDEASIKRAEQLQEAWAGIRSRLQAVGMTIFEALLPHLEKAVGYLERFSGWVDSNSGRIATFFSGVGDILSGVVDFLRDMHEQTGGWSTKILAAAAAFMTFKGVLGSILSMTGLPMLLKLLGGGAAGGAGLAALGKLGLVGAAGAAGWGIGSLINKRFVEGTETGNTIGRTIAKGLAAFGHKNSREALNAEARANGQALPYPELDSIQKTGKAQAATATHQLEEAKKGNKATTQAASEQNNWLKKIESGISKMNAAFEAGYNGMPQPTDGGLPGDVGYTGGKAAASVVDAVAGYFKRGEGDYDSVNLGKRHGYGASRRNLAGMTVGEVMAAQARGDFNAAGRYQMIRGTLAEAVNALGVDKSAKFDKTMQDRLFIEYLLKHKRPKIWRYISGKSGNIMAAGVGVSREWAAFANPLTGRGNYDKPGVNKATISAEQTLQMLRAARAGYQAQYAGSRSEVQINGGIHINTAATDANGIAQEIRPAVNRNLAGVTALGMS